LPPAGELTLWQLNHVSSLPSYGMRDHVTMLKTMTDKAGVNNLMTNVLTAMSKEQKAAMDEQVRCCAVLCGAVLCVCVCVCEGVDRFRCGCDGAAR
jgi:hypothetical protein